MIYYSTMLHNELEMLQLQLTINYQIVDKFIIIEANKTFSGINKPYYFLKNKELFKKYENKIIYIQIEHPDIIEDIELKNLSLSYVPYKSNWIREKNQRESFLTTLPFDDNDLIFFSDVDEIVFLDKVLPQIHYDKINYFKLIHCKYYVNTTDIPIQYVTRANCCYPYKIYKKYKNIIKTHFNIRKLNFICDDYIIIDNSGYHLSLCYDFKEKLQGFSHGEYNTESCLGKLIDEKRLLTKNNVIEIPEIITKNVPQRFIYLPTLD